MNGCKNKDQKETETDDECQGAYHAEAFEALNKAYKWFEKQDKSNCFKMLQLKQIRDLSAMKRCDSLRQRSITKIVNKIGTYYDVIHYI